MTPGERLTEVLKKKGVEPNPSKTKVKESTLTSSAKQIAVLMQIARDLGYVE